MNHADESSGNTTKDITSPDETDLSSVTRNDVVEIIGACEVNGDYAEWEGVGLFKLRDGRFLAASGGCDTTGWDCRACNTLTVCSTLEAAIQYGLTTEGRELLLTKVE